jgi:hypothetical protein
MPEAMISLLRTYAPWLEGGESSKRGKRMRHSAGTGPIGAMSDTVCCSSKRDCEDRPNDRA